MRYIFILLTLWAALSATVYATTRPVQHVAAQERAYCFAAPIGMFLPCAEYDDYREI